MAAAFPSDPEALESDVDAITVYRGEEHDLLDSAAVSMSDVAFSRADSEEVILAANNSYVMDPDDVDDDDDDVTNVTGFCCRSRTPLERCLLVLLLLLVAVIAGLAVGLSRPQHIARKRYCQSSQCVQAASSLMASMDREADPCVDFFQYACGGWVRDHPIPKGYSRWDRIQQLAAQNFFVLKTLLDSQTSVAGEAERKAQTFYNSCMAEASVPHGAALRHFGHLLTALGGWSGSSGSQVDRWQVVNTLRNVHHEGAWPLFRVKVDVDERDPTRRYILKIDLGETVLPMEMYPPLHPPPTTATSSPSLNTTANTGNSSYSSSSSSNSAVLPSPSLATAVPAGIFTNPTATTTTTTTTTTESSAEIWERVKKQFLEETAPVLQALGVNSTASVTQALAMAELERDLAAAAEGMRGVQDRFSLYNVFTVAELETNFTMLGWRHYFSSQGFELTPSDQVVVLYPGYMANLTTLLNEATSSPVRMSTLRDYLLVILIRSLRHYFDPSLFDMQDKDSGGWLQEAWKRCVFYTNQAVGFATGAVFVRRTGQENSVEKIQNLISYVRAAFKEFILRKFWIDSATRKKAEQKVDNIINKINYPSYILNTSFLDTYYKEFIVQKEDWFQNLLNWRHFERYRQQVDLHSTPDRQRSWIRPPVTVKAVYSPTRNDVIFPIAMFHLPYYIPGGPAAVNFGAMGSVIGHEITHAFDFQGRQYDEEGRLKNWWDRHSTKNFAITTECMARQYDNMRVQGQQVNGNFTLDENIADNGGLRAAHYAYRRWVEEHGEEVPLPSLNLSQHQVFFLSYAQMFCSKWTDTGLKYHLLTDRHSPGKARVNGVLANSKLFSWAFKCPIYSKMNAQTKCEVW